MRLITIISRKIQRHHYFISLLVLSAISITWYHIEFSSSWTFVVVDRLWYILLLRYQWYLIVSISARVNILHSQCWRHQFQSLVLIRHWCHHRIASQIAPIVPCFLIVFSLSLSNRYQTVPTARWSFVIDPHRCSFPLFCQSSSSRLFRLASIRLRRIITCESRITAFCVLQYPFWPSSATIPRYSCWCQIATSESSR